MTNGNALNCREKKRKSYRPSISFTGKVDLQEKICRALSRGSRASEGGRDDDVLRTCSCVGSGRLVGLRLRMLEIGWTHSRQSSSKQLGEAKGEKSAIHPD